jgi:hypothetical protein
MNISYKNEIDKYDKWWNFYKGKNNEKDKDGFVKFCENLKELNGEIQSNYYNSRDNIKIKIDEIEFYKTTSSLQIFLKSINTAKLKMELTGDKYVKIIGKALDGNIIVNIDTFDGANIEIVLGNYYNFTSGRINIFNKVKSNGDRILSPYKGSHEKILMKFNCKYNNHIAWIRPNNYIYLKEKCPYCSGNYILKG